jgi:hypothetical protein
VILRYLIFQVVEKGLDEASRAFLVTGRLDQYSVAEGLVSVLGRNEEDMNWLILVLDGLLGDEERRARGWRGRG